MDERRGLANGDFVAMSLGEFLSTIVDSGTEDIVIVRETGRSEMDEDKQFALRMEVHLVPARLFPDYARSIGCELIDGRLNRMIEKGLISGLRVRDQNAQP